MREKRYEGLDILKIICAFLVVCIHVPTSLRIYENIVVLSRVAVPIFFMITGFFWNKVVIEHQEKNQIVKILKLIVTSVVIYLAWIVIYGNLIGKNLIKNYEKVFTKELIELVFFNKFSLAGHLWYLFAILYIMILMQYLYRILKYNKSLIYIFIIILLLFQLLLGNYSWIINKYFLPEITRNFFITGLPYFLIGAITEKNIKILKEKFFMWKIIIILMLSSIIEANLLKNMNYIIDKDIYITTIFLSYIIFVKMLYMKNDNKYLSNIGLIGKKYSTPIYIWHNIFHTILFILSKKLGLLDIYQILAPILVFSVIIICCIFYQKIKNKIKGR